MLNETRISLLVYADDIVLLGEDKCKVVDLCNRLIESGKKVGLHIIPKKTEYMEVSRELENIHLTDTITVGQYKIKKVEQFKYLSITDKRILNRNSTKN